MNEKQLLMRTLANMLNADYDLSQKGITFSAELTWIDMGANWSEETIIVRGDSFTFQALSPRQIEEVHNKDIYKVFNDVKEYMMERY